MMLKRLLLPALLVSLPLTGHASEDIYRSRAEDGSVLFSDQRAAPASAQRQQTPQLQNSYRPQQPHSSQPAHNNSGTVLQAVTGTSPDSTETTPKQRDCEAEYGLTCERVDNWLRYARKACLERGDDRCDDPDYLERRYKPRPLAETREVARRAAIRRNRAEERAVRELQMFFTEYCKDRLETYCSTQKEQEKCEERYEQSCRDGGDLEKLLSKYQQLTPVQQARVRQTAERLGVSSDNQLTEAFKGLMKLLGLAG